MVQPTYYPTPPPRPGKKAPLWKCMCDGCGAPLQRTELQCSYCKRATMAEARVSIERRYEEREIQGWVAAGLLTLNQARELVTK